MIPRDFAILEVMSSCVLRRALSQSRERKFYKHVTFFSIAIFFYVSIEVGGSTLQLVKMEIKVFDPKVLASALFVQTK